MRILDPVERINAVQQKRQTMVQSVGSKAAGQDANEFSFREVLTMQIQAKENALTAEQAVGTQIADRANVYFPQVTAPEIGRIVEAGAYRT